MSGFQGLGGCRVYVSQGHGVQASGFQGFRVSVFQGLDLGV